MTHLPELPFLPTLAKPPRLSEDRRGHRGRITTLPPTIPEEQLSGVDRRRRADRRAAPRLQIELDCEERLPHRRYVRRTLDLSVFGVALKDGKRHEKGAQVNLALYLPDAVEPLEMRAQVVGPAPGFRGGVRMAFRQPPVESVQRIHRFIRSAT